MKLTRIVIISALILALLMLGWFVVPRVMGGHSCHGAAAQEEEGNPSHKEPTAQCNHKPKAGQVACKCMKQCDAEHKQEDSRCKSYCFKWWCTCPPCA